VTRRAWIVMAYAAVVAASAVGARYPADWWLENLVVFAAAAGVALAWRRFVFSDLSLLLLALFGSLHAYGAHYTYSETPLGNGLRDALGLARNPYDRVVHFAFGLLVTYPLRELALRVVHARRVWSFVLPLVAALSISASYELAESWAARITAPELGTAFLGTQGDEWDAQKDMAAALAGACVALAATGAARRVAGREPWIATRPRHRRRRSPRAQREPAADARRDVRRADHLAWAVVPRARVVFCGAGLRGARRFSMSFASWFTWRLTLWISS
jgi:putative membrane protein